MSERTDTDRLDWLESKKDPAWPLWGVEMDGRFLAALQLCTEHAEDMAGVGEDLREAIDAAMDAEGQLGTEP